MSLFVRVIEKIVLSGVDGTILILPLILLSIFMIGQAKDCIRTVREVWREEDLERNM